LRYATADLIGDVLLIAPAYAISSYDACYVALAQRLSVHFLTADEALVRKLAGTSYIDEQTRENLRPASNFH